MDPDLSRSKVLTFRVTETEAALIRAEADRIGVSLTEYLRRRAVPSVRQPDTTRPTVVAYDTFTPSGMLIWNRSTTAA